MKPMTRKILVVLMALSLLGAGCARILESELSAELVQAIAGTDDNFKQSRRVIITLEPADLDTYREVLPEQFDMPEHPLVQLHMIDQTDVGPWPLTPYKEACVNLRGAYQGEDGWHIVFLPVSTWVSKYAGRTMGYPKFLADQVSFEETAGGIKSEVKHKGRSLLLVEFTTGEWQDQPVWIKEGWDLGGPVLNLMPPGEGPDVITVGMSGAMPPSTIVEKGTAFITADPDQPFAGLIPAGVSLPAEYVQINEARSLVPEEG